MKKSSLLSASLFSLALFSFAALSANAQAQSPSATSSPARIAPVIRLENKNFTQSAVEIADLSIENIRASIQSGRTYTVTFDLLNGEPALSDVKYSANLVSSSSTIVDQEIFSESLDLPANSTTTRTFTYTAPAGISGSFLLVIKAKNDAGIPLASGTVGAVNIPESPAGVSIIFESCSPASGTVSCVVENLSSSSQSVVPVFDIYDTSVYGTHLATVVGASSTLISVGENRYSFPLPQISGTGVRALSLTLQAGESDSNNFVFSLAVAGKSASVDFLSLDKSSYEKGDNILATLIWSHGPIVDASGAVLSPHALLTVSSNGAVCGQTDWKLSPNIPIATTTIPSLVNCPNANASIALLDGTTTLSSAQYMTHPSPSTLISSTSWLIALGALILIILVAFLIRHFSKHA